MTASVKKPVIFASEFAFLTCVNVAGAYVRYNTPDYEQMEVKSV
ncbi:MAG: hypothetical protein ACP5R5_00120 [Armatimonadota bacterium]